MIFKSLIKGSLNLTGKALYKSGYALGSGLKFSKNIGSKVLNEAKGTTAAEYFGINTARKWMTGVSNLSRTPMGLAHKMMRRPILRMQAKIRKGQANANSSLSHTVKWGRRSVALGSIGIGTLGMIGVGVMKGMMDQSREFTFDRYMQDYTYSKNVLANSRLSGTLGSSMIDYNSTMGLSNALSKSRHGI